MSEEQAVVEKILKPEDVATLSEELQPARDHSRELGLKLGLPGALVERIHGKFPDPDDCLRHILIEFTSRLKLRRTRRAIAEALRSRDINLPALADSVERSSKEDVSYSSYDVATEETREAPSTSTSTALARGTLGQICTARFVNKVPPEGYQRMTTEHDWPESTKFTEVDRFQESFIDTFGLSKSDMIYVGIYKGYWQYYCINWFTRLPRVALGRIRDMGRVKLFVDFKVYSVKVDGEYLYPRTNTSPQMARKLEPRYHLQSIESDSTESKHESLEMDRNAAPEFLRSKSVKPRPSVISRSAMSVKPEGALNVGEPKITHDVCSSCLTAINKYVDFNVLQRELEKRGVSEKHLIDCIRGIKRKPPRYRHRIHQIEHMIRRLDLIENGFQLFYQCLRETEKDVPNHRVVADDLQNTAYLMSSGHYSSQYYDIAASPSMSTFDVEEPNVWEESSDDVVFAPNVRALLSEPGSRALPGTLAYSTSTRSPSEYRRHALRSSLQLQSKEATFRKESKGFHSVSDVAHSGWPVSWRQQFSQPSSHALSYRSKPHTIHRHSIEKTRFPDYGVKRHLIQPETEPKITRNVCLNCLDVIVKHVNLEILEPLFKKYSVPVDILSTVHQLSSHYWHPSLADRRQRVVMLLYKLNRVENGYQIFYCCLRDSQLSDPGHAFIVLHMKSEAEFILHTPITGSEESIDSNTTEIVYGSCSYHICGLDLSLPAMTVKLSVIRVHDDYILPSEYEEMPLVSEMYKITTRGGPLPVPVTVRMEHCAVVEEEDCLIHMIAHGPPPYQFQPLPGGKFPIGESYGEIELTEFSILTTIAKKLGWRMSLSVQPFYHRNNTATIVVTKNIRSLIQAAKREYSEATVEPSQSLLCDYATEAIAFTVPSGPQAGWEIVPKYRPPKIQTKLIREFKEGKTPPSITLKMNWVGEDEPRDGEVDIGVEGCSIESFSLTCSAYLARRQQLSQQIAAQPQVPDTPLTSPSPSQTQTIPQPIQTPFSSHLSSSPTVSPDISSESHTTPPSVEKSMATSKLDRVITDHDIAEICRKYLKNWEGLYPYLKLTNVKESIKEAGDYAQQKRALLEEWKKKYGKRATFSDLISAAEEAENRDLADNIELYAIDL